MVLRDSNNQPVNFSSLFGYDMNAVIMKYSNYYTQNLDKTLSAENNGFAVNSTLTPILGKPNQYIAIGINGAVGFANIKYDTNKPAGTELNNMSSSLGIFGKANLLTVSGGFSPYITISLGWLKRIFDLNYFENSDLTFKYMYFKTPSSWDTFQSDMNSFGLIFRKQIKQESKLIPYILSFSGINYSGGFNYLATNLKLKVNINSAGEYSVVDFGGGTTGIVKYNLTTSEFNIKNRYFNYDSTLKAYFNLLYLIDIYGGLGLTLNIGNSYKVEGEIKGSIQPGVDVSGTKTYTPELANNLYIYGDINGQTLIPRMTLGSQLNIWVIKLGFQYNVAYLKEYNIKTFTMGVSIAF